MLFFPASPWLFVALLLLPAEILANGWGTGEDVRKVRGFSYNGFGAVKTLYYGNSRRLTLTYDVNRHQMQTMKVDNQNGTDTILNKTYAYQTAGTDPNTRLPYQDNDGRIKKITDAVDSAYTTTYGYDLYNRLMSANSAVVIFHLLPQPG